MISKLPTGAWEKTVKPLMVMPLLLRLSLIDPLRRMPLSWLDSDKLPDDYPVHITNNTDLVAIRYWELCSMMKEGPLADEGSGFFVNMHKLAYGVLHIILSRETHQIPSGRYFGLQQQIYVLGG